MKKSIFGRAGFIVFAVANVSLILYGLLVLARPQILLDPFTQQVYRFPEEAARATGYLKAIFRLLGFFNGILGVLGWLLLQRWHSAQEAWLLRLAILATILAYLGPIVFDNTVGNIGFFEIVEHILFALMLIFSVILWRAK